MAIIFWGIITAVLLLVAVIGYNAQDTEKKRNGDYTKPAVIGLCSTIAFLFFLIPLLCLSVYTVKARQVGIPVTFGKVGAAQKSGLHLKSAFTKVYGYSSTTQALKLRGDGKAADDDAMCLTVRFSNNAQGCVDVQMNWSIDTNSQTVSSLYGKWKDFSNIEPKFIKPVLENLVLGKMSTYNPIPAENAESMPVAKFEGEIVSELQEKLGKDIKIERITLNMASYDQATQDKLNAIGAAIANTRIAKQDQQTKLAQAQAETQVAQQREETNKALARANAALSQSTDEKVLQQNCLDMTERMLKEGRTFPQTWNCGNAAATMNLVGK